MIRGTFNRTLYGTLLITACATVLTACGGSDGSSMPGNDANDSKRQSLLYAYPDDGQAEVPTKAPVVLRFTSDVSLGDVEQSVTLCCDAEGGNLDYTAETVGPDPRGVILTPAQSLSPLTDYTIAIKNLRLRNGTATDRTLRFTTRPLAEGPRSLVVKDEGFAIDRQMPNGDTNEPIMDFSSFRFQFTQPVDRASARYGDTVVLTDSSGDTVEATLLINGHYMTVDPKPEYLTPGQSYTLSLTNGLTSTFDEAFAGTEISFTPADSSPRGEPAMLVQRITQSGLSRLTGKNINQVPVNGTLLGEDVNVTQASADAVVAELADVTEYPDVTPIRLPRGTKLTGSAIEMVMIGGEVPAGFGSGPVDMRLTSDATGYLVPNPYNVHNRADALRIVHLLMDVGIATEDPRANGGFTQDIMHIELVGVAEVDTEAGVLNLDAVGMVEPNILGQEYGYGLLSFQLQSYKDQMNAPTAPEDKTGPTLQSWTLGTDTLTGEDKSLLAKPGDPIILNFDEPIDPQSANDAITLSLNGEPVEFDLWIDGAAVVISPERLVSQGPGKSTVIQYLNGIEESEENSRKIYTLHITPDITDSSGNPINVEINKNFELPILTQNKKIVIPSTNYPELDNLINHAPIVLAAYPGFPCALSKTGRNLNKNIAGRCKGAFSGISDGTDVDNQPADDNIPVMEMPKHRPILVQFSKKIDPQSIVLGQTFKVQKISDSEDVISSVDGKLEIFPNRIKFTPNDVWQEGQLYRYTLESSGYTVGTLQGNVPKLFSDNNYQCGTDSICDTSGLPLQTQPIGITTIEHIGETGNDRNYAVLTTGPDFEAGGPPMQQYFRGTEESKNVVQILSTLPVSDTNGNLFHESPNIGTSTDPGRSIGVYDYDIFEYGPTNIPTSKYPDYDPGGLKPSKNSAKVLSRFNSQGSIGATVNGANLGCDYIFITDIPLECPSEKFTYLMSSIVAEVTDEVTDKGLKVIMWPSQVLGTSMPLFGLTDFGILIPVPGHTGPQILRMRYGTKVNNEDPTIRNQPINAWIREEQDSLVLEAEVELYITAPYITEYGVGTPENTYNLGSYPIKMTLSGPVNFLDDGRMEVEQFNINKVDIMLQLHGRSSGAGDAGYVDLFIPEYGSRLNFISNPIK
ncbi:Ig-like domain-containing protein [Alloalcanivorax xenomutans]|uniref:Ig-like domain-containing protein n=1 Tax=Alloalcanivorax xenomutans TaxID=1094342 RepID=UPI003BA8F8F2